MANEIDIVIGSNLRQRRLARGMTQVVLGLACADNLSSQQISKYELGEDQINAARLTELARILDFPITSFFDGIDGTLQKLEDKGTLSAMSSYSGLPKPVQESLRELMKAMTMALGATLKQVER